MVKQPELILDHDILRQAQRALTEYKATESKDGWFLTGGKKDETKIPESISLMRSLFKPDHPYRTRLGYGSNVATSASGVVNFQLLVSSVGSVSEWSSIDALFDEFFVHSVRVIYKPRNFSSGGSSAAGSAGLLTTTGAWVTSSGLGWVSLFHNAGFYTSFNSSLANPTFLSRHSGSPHTYTWRNNVKFEPRGLAISAATTESWQGWTLISNSSAYGGSIQARAFSDIVIGDAVHPNILGDVAVVFDVSFRARA